MFIAIRMEVEWVRQIFFQFLKREAHNKKTPDLYHCYYNNHTVGRHASAKVFFSNHIKGVGGVILKDYLRR